MSTRPLLPKYLGAIPLPTIASTSFHSVKSDLTRWLTTRVNLRPTFVVLGAELALVAAAFLLNMHLFASILSGLQVAQAAATFLLLLLALRGAALILFGVFQRSLRYASTADMIAIAKSVGASGFAWYLIYRIGNFGPRVPSVLFISDAVVSFLFLSALHFSVPIYNSHRARNARGAKRVIVVGAGDAGAAVLNELLRDPQSGIRPVAIIDDDCKKKGTRICGVPVVSTVANLQEMALRFDASEVLVCIPTATEAQMRQILTACRQCGVPVRTLPSVSELVTDHVSWRDLRSIRIEDVLQRKQAVLDGSLSKALVQGKVVLVTGAGGSIGSELSRQLAAAGPRRLILLDKSENNLFYSHMAIQEGWPAINVKLALADILDEHQLEELFVRERPDLVFHAAAFKHVGMMELHPYQAIRNNVLGTWNLLTAALKSDVKVFVNISTDKAVNPCNYMGLSKKLAERLVRGVAVRYHVAFMNVRFGNVAGSSGSVLQIFGEQIKKGGPLRVTDPQASRYFMSITEAVYLVLCAATLGRGGETYILDMGDPVNIYELARAVSLLSGFAPDEELPIQFTGLKKGEKVHEELWESWEQPKPTAHPQIFALAGTDPLPIDMLSVVGELRNLVEVHDREGLLTYIGELVPGFAVERMPLSA